jgi:hypothetical protein
MLLRVVWQILTDVSEILAASVIRAIREAVCTSETSVYFCEIHVAVRTKNLTESISHRHTLGHFQSSQEDSSAECYRHVL